MFGCMKAQAIIRVTPPKNRAYASRLIGKEILRRSDNMGSNDCETAFKGQYGGFFASSIVGRRWWKPSRRKQEAQCQPINSRFFHRPNGDFGTN